MHKARVISICDSVILFSLYAMAFFLPISKAIIESLASIAITAFIVKKIIQREIPKTPFNLSVVVYLIICFFSIFISTNIKISVRTFAGRDLENALVFFVIASSLDRRNKIQNFLYIFFLSSLLLGVDGIYQHFNRIDFIRHRVDLEIPRIYACFSAPNGFGSYLATLIPFMLVQFFIRRNPVRVKILIAGLSALLLTCLVLTVSRGAWFAFLISVLFMSIWLKPIAVFLIITVGFIILTHSFYHPVLRNRLNDLFVFMDKKIDVDRWIVWRAGWNMFLSRPLIGLGLGTFMFHFNRFIIEGYKYGIAYAHNCYLQMACEIGIIGLAAFLALLAAFFYRGIRALKNNERNFFWYILLASLSALLGFCVQMGVDTTFYALDLGMLFWMILGLGAAMIRNIEMR